MRKTRIYTPQALRSGAQVRLEPEPSRHLARALRLGPGDSLLVFDGRGGEYEATITSVERSIVTVTTGELRPGDCDSRLHIHLGIAISRGERMDWVVQKATELGVCEISPLVTERTGVKLNTERAENRLRHWQQVAASACEQCGRCLLPSVHPLRCIGEWLKETRATLNLVLHPGDGDDVVRTTSPDSIALLVGPEGGFSDTELALAREAGYRGLRLGPRVLRTETAPLAALALLQGRWGDMGPL